MGFFVCVIVVYVLFLCCCFCSCPCLYLVTCVYLLFGLISWLGLGPSDLFQGCLFQGCLSCDELCVFTHSVNIFRHDAVKAQQVTSKQKRPRINLPKLLLKPPPRGPLSRDKHRSESELIQYGITYLMCISIVHGLEH